ncbi:MAG: lysine 2,3-aminomutase, partial [Chloroflexi bacterium]|nr:lysine 2,3-aminomutase [Chloroflexota bacterium]
MKETEKPPGKPPQRFDPWRDIPRQEWNDWHWQMRHRINTAEKLRQVIHLTPDEEMAIALEPDLKMGITPYFALLMDPDDPHCPIRKQVVPTTQEFVLEDPDLEDPLHEDVDSPVPGLTHRYPDRVLVLITDQCVSYCRFCTRRRVVGTGEMPVSKPRIEAIAQYIERTAQVRDILISGGDGLFVSDEILDFVLARFRRIPHVEIIRFGTRVPVFLPQRITESMCNTLKKYHPIWMNIHVNHPKEITPELAEACARLADAGVPLGCQSVLMAGINDCPNVIKKLVHELLKIRVRPYYLYQCDLSQGIGHFRTPVSVGLNIIEALRGHTTGFAVPTYVIDAPGGGGKVPAMPQYVISQSQHKVVMRNYEGVISTYTQPKHYTSHDPATCEYCRAARPPEGIAKLLAGQALTLEPADLARRQRSRPPEPGMAIPLIPVPEPVPLHRESRHPGSREVRGPRGNGSK